MSPPPPRPFLGSTEIEPIEAVKAQTLVEDFKEAQRTEKKERAVDHAMVISEVQLLLAEKRTAFSLMRTGVTVSLVPLSILSLFIATSRLWSVWDVWWILVPFALVLSTMLFLGVYLIMHSIEHLAHNDRVLMGLRASDTLLEDLLIHHGRADRVIKPWKWRHETSLRSVSRKRSG